MKREGAGMKMSEERQIENPGKKKMSKKKMNKKKEPGRTESRAADET